MEDLSRRKAMQVAAVTGAAAAGLATSTLAAQQQRNGDQPAELDPEAQKEAEAQLKAEPPPAATENDRPETVSAAAVAALRKVWFSVLGDYLINNNKARGMFRIPGTNIHVATSMKLVGQVGAWYRLTPNGLPPATFGTIVVDVTRMPWGNNRNSVVFWIKRPGATQYISYRDDNADAGFAYGDLL